MALDEVGYLGARAILWHQGESDLASGTTTEDYTSMLNEVIMGSRIAAGWDIPWVVARASYLPGFSAESLAVIVDAQQTVIDNDSLTYLGPDTDNLIGDSWRYDTVHFNGEGLREHARLWDISISVMMEDFLGWDDDGDGVENTQDDCEDTPIGEPTYADGCSDSQRDSDIDGVSDAVDLCPGFDDALDLDLDRGDFLESPLFSSMPNTPWASEMTPLSTFKLIILFCSDTLIISLKSCPHLLPVGNRFNIPFRYSGL
jgi:hypothetical protein